MTAYTLRKALALGALTGMRSFSGPAALAIEQQGGLLGTVLGVMAAAEMIADKSASAPDRIAAGPLAGRAVIGALVGGVIAYEERDNVALGGLVGAAAAVAAAHLAWHARKRLPMSNVAGGLLEDAVVIGLSAAAVQEI